MKDSEGARSSQGAGESEGKNTTRLLGREGIPKALFFFFFWD